MSSARVDIVPKGLDPYFPRRDEDAAWLAHLHDVPVRPVFIMGLHRSGTTFLYDCIAKSFPVAQLSLYHLFYYQRLLSNRRCAGEVDDKALLNACFADRGIDNRVIDSVPVNADEVEEYGFLLRRHSGTFKLCEENAELFSEMCQKLLSLDGEAQAVLLKNPWDTGNAAWILQRFPEARFVYISREPMAVLNSMLNAVLSYLRGPQHYLEMLLSVDGSRRGYRAGYMAWQFLRGVRGLVGETRIARWARGPLAKTVARQVAAYRREVASLPSDRAVELSYAELVADPQGTMDRLQDLLALPVKDDRPLLEVRSRKHINPALDEFQAELDRLVAREAA